MLAELGRIVSLKFQEEWRREEGLREGWVLMRMMRDNIEDTDQGCSVEQAEDTLAVLASGAPPRHSLDPGISHWNVVFGQMTEAIQGIPAMLSVVSTCSNPAHSGALVSVLMMLYQMLTMQSGLGSLLL